jgi:N-acetylmuramoyl-L-alanine amidase
MSFSRPYRIAFTLFVVSFIVFAAGGALAVDGPSVVREIRHWTGPDYTRVVMDVKGPARYTVNRLNSPARVYLDFSGMKLGAGSKAVLPVNDGLLGSIRSAQYDKNTVRVVLELNDSMGFKVFSLKSPTRIVVDVFPKKRPAGGGEIAVVKKSAALPAAKPKTASPSVAKKPSSTAKASSAPWPARKPAAKPAPESEKHHVVKSLKPDRNAALRPRRVVIDAGHGGKDPGATAYGLREKDIVLDLAKRVKRELEAKGGYQVVLTRSTDRFLELEERAQVANKKDADIFVSIHCNASRNRRARGLETYILGMSDEKSALEVAARENMVSEREMRKKRDDLGSILASMSLTRDTIKSGALAGNVQKSMVTSLSKSYSRIRNNKDRGAMFYVLYRAHMPSILVEVSYLTNKEEARRLRSTAYRRKAAAGIAAGIHKYFKDEALTQQRIAMR